MAATDSLVQTIDVYVGARIRARRRTLGLSEPRLALALGVPLPMLQAYQSGAVRCGVLTLFRLCRILDTPLGYFYDGLKDRDGQTEHPPATVCYLRSAVEGGAGEP